MITRTNRNGVTYYLCEGETKVGKPRYWFGKEPGTPPVHQIPDGYEIHENVHGIVTLGKIQPKLWTDDEVEAVEAALGRLPRPFAYRLEVKGKALTISESSAPDATELACLFELGPDPVASRQGDFDRHTRFVPMMRFSLIDAERRLFEAERWCFLGSVDDWISLAYDGPLRHLCAKLIPLLGTEEFFEQGLEPL